MSSTIHREGIPTVVRAYLDRLRENDTEGVLNVFAEGAVVVDEGHTYRGISEIREWLNGAASEYTYTSTETGYDLPSPDIFVVHTHLSGNFPGGEADLTSIFTHAEGRITRLENS